MDTIKGAAVPTDKEARAEACAKCAAARYEKWRAWIDEHGWPERPAACFICDGGRLHRDHSIPDPDDPSASWTVVACSQCHLVASPVAFACKICQANVNVAYIAQPNFTQIMCAKCWSM